MGFGQSGLGGTLMKKMRRRDDEKTGCERIRSKPGNGKPVTIFRIGLSLLAICVAWSPVAFALPEEELVPGGAWFLKMTETRTTETKAIDRQGKKNALKSYVIPDPDQSEATSGSIQRERAETEARINYGLGEQWNLALRLPMRSASQQSTLANGTADETAQIRLDTLGNKEISGLGDVRLSLLFRPLYTDRNAVLWGFGLTMPGSNQHIPFVDASTLEITELVNRYSIMMQYTRFPMIARSRFDLVVIGFSGSDAKVEKAGGGQGTLEPGTEISAKMGWLQEVGAISLGLESDYRLNGANRIDGQGLYDNSLRWVYRLHMGFGNLAVLEGSGEVWPYRIMLGWEQVLRGFNTPTDAVMTLSLETFF